MKSRTENKKKLRRQARAKAFSGVLSERPQRRFCLMAKPAGPACNLRCQYCFYLEKDALFEHGQSRRMSDEVLEAYVRKYIESQPSSEVAFHWQGGEPTLAGIDFFRKAVELQRKFAGSKRITNTLQTNGTLLDDRWGQFLADGDWLVGLSLDGPSDIHNLHRLDAMGNGTFDSVMRGMGALLRHRVEFNVLASVTPASTAEPLRVYEFLKHAGVKFVQFMPIVERMPDDAARELGLQLAVGIRSGEHLQTVRVTPWSVQPEAYGDFLCRIFDRWVRNDVGSFFVMNFEWAMAAYEGLPPRVCQFMPICGCSPIIEHNGDVYACDHYVYPEYRLGNILTDDLQDMIQSKDQCAFGEAKHMALPDCCLRCRVLVACQGECPKRRFLQSPDGQPGLNYMCEGYKRFFEHAAPYLEAMRRLDTPASRYPRSWERKFMSCRAALCDRREAGVPERRSMKEWAMSIVRTAGLFIACVAAAAQSQAADHGNSGSNWLSFAQDQPPALPASPKASRTHGPSPVRPSLTAPTAAAPSEEQKAPHVAEKPWEVRLKVYAWVPSVHGRAGVGRAVSDVDVSICEVLDNIDLVECMVPVDLEARCGHWGFIADLMYVRLEDQFRIGPRRGIKVNQEGQQTILELAGFYRAGTWPLDPKCGKSVTLDLIGGARYNRLEGNIGLQHRGHAISVGGVRDWWDPFVGPRVIWQATDKISLFARGDVGGFGLEHSSHFAWQFLGGIEYDITKNIFLELGYRLLDTDFEQGGRRHFTYDVQMAGPYLALGVKF